MAMLLGVCNLFLKPHVLPLLRLMCDAAELLHAGVGGAGPGAPASAPHGTDVNAWRSSPRCLALLEQLQRLEPQPQAACASLTLAKLHSELEDLDAHLVEVAAPTICNAESTQTARFMFRPPTPEYQPAKTGVRFIVPSSPPMPRL